MLFPKGLILYDNYFLIFLKPLALETGSEEINQKIKEFKFKTKSVSY